MSHRPSEDTKVIFQDFDVSTKDTLVLGTRVSGRFIDVSGYNRVMCIALREVGVGSVQDAAIYVATDVAGTSATKVTSSATGSTEATGAINIAAGTIGAAGAGMVVMECDTSDLDSTLANGRFVGAKMSLATATDEFALIWILTEPRIAEAGLTASGNA